MTLNYAALVSLVLAWPPLELSDRLPPNRICVDMIHAGERFVEFSRARAVLDPANADDWLERAELSKQAMIFWAAAEIATDQYRDNDDRRRALIFLGDTWGPEVFWTDDWPDPIPAWPW